MSEAEAKSYSFVTSGAHRLAISELIPFAIMLSVTSPTLAYAPTLVVQRASTVSMQTKEEVRRCRFFGAR